MNRRIIIAMIIGAAALIILVVGIATRRTPQTATTAPTEVQYTNAVTGSAASDIIGETSGLDPNAVTFSGVTIDGIDVIYPYLTNDQASNAQDIVSDFLMARSGLNDVHGAVKDNLITQTGNQISFTLVVMKPQVTYQVIITVQNTYQTTPNVVINRIGV